MRPPTHRATPPPHLYFHSLNLTSGAIVGALARANRADLLLWQSTILDALGSQPLRWRACAVVGSSNSLMHTARGALIDGHAAVFRINAAPTVGFERHAGRRTTVRLWGVETAPGPTTPIVWGTHPKLPAASEPDTLPVCACPPVKWLDRCWREIGVASNRTAGLTPSQQRAASAPRLSPGVKFALREQIRQAARRKSGYGQHPTTGALAVHVALHSCDEPIGLFGFGNCSKTSLARSKYYDRHQGRKSYLGNLRKHHDYEAEQAWLRALVKQGRAVDHEGCLGGLLEGERCTSITASDLQCP